MLSKNNHKKQRCATLAIVNSCSNSACSIVLGSCRILNDLKHHALRAKKIATDPSM